MQIRRVLLILTMLVIASATARSAEAAPTCITIQRGTNGAVADTFIESNHTGTNNGADKKVWTGIVGGRRQTLLKFDLSAIPSGSTISSATVTLDGPTLNGIGVVRAHRITAAWGEGTVTWSSFAGAFDAAVAVSFVNGILGLNDPVSFDLKTLVAAWVAGQNPNYGILLEQDPLFHSDYRSSEFNTVSSRPKIKVCYTPPAVVVCGDGVISAGETCDDHNTGSGDGCSSSCHVETGYTCSGSPSACHTTCGDGIRAGAEECDDGNGSATDGCAACVIQNGYTCSGSPSVCHTSCGDGIVAGSEACDDGNAINGDGCTASCGAELGYVCAGSPSVCATVCGDGVVAGSEACDDADLVSGDGCSSTCTVESGYTCSMSPSICGPICGDGVVLSGEGCDDGNGSSGDGCSSACTVEAGFSCAGSPSACAAVCGDGMVKGSEGCDDGNLASGDGCSAACAVEGGFSCAGSPSVCTCANGTPCNDGNACTQGDVCGSGSCAGTPIACNPGECQTAGVCNPATGCVFFPAPDGDACTGGACTGGACVTTELLVTVYDRNGDPIVGARVRVGATQILTNATGQVTFTALPSGNTVARVTATGFAPASPSTDVQAGTKNSIVAHMLFEGEAVPFEVGSGIDTIAHDTVHVAIPGSGLVYGSGINVGQPVTGVVEMTVAPLDPSTDLDVMPGALVGLPEGSVTPVGMFSVYMADISLRQGTTPVQLAPGATATIEFTLPEPLQGDYSVGDTIDAWYFDLVQGIWIQDGFGTVVDSLAEPGKLAWKKDDVEHFTWWNADFWKPLQDCVIVTVQQSDTPLPIGGATVSVQSLSNNYYLFTGVTDNLTGQTCINMPINDVVRVTASHTTFPNIVGGAPQILTGTSSTGPTCPGTVSNACKTLTILLGGTTCVSGSVTDGVGGFIDGAKVIARYNTGRGPESATTLSDVNGDYCVSAPVGTQVLVQANSLGNVKTSEVTVDTGLTAGACGAISCTPAPDLTPACTSTCSTFALGDGNNAIQTAKDVAVDASGNMFITGYFAGTLPVLGLTSSPNVGNEDIYVAKFAPDGTLLWAKSFGDVGGTGTQQAYSIAVDSIGNPVIVGSFTIAITFPRPSGLGNFTLTVPAGHGFDGFITKLSGIDGTAIEARLIGGAGNQRIVDVMMDNSDPVNYPDSVVFLAYFNEEIDCSGGAPPPFQGFCPATGGPAGGDDILITKIFSDNFYVWSQTYGGTGNEHVTHGAIDASGKLIITGDFDSSFSFGGGTGTLVPSSSGSDAFVARIQIPKAIDFSDAAPIWAKAYGAGGCGSPGNRFGRGAAYDGLGNVWFTGDFNGCILFSTVETAAGAPATDAFIARLNAANGNTLSYDIVRNASQQHGSDMAVDTDGGLLFTGTVRGSITFGALAPLAAIGLEDVFVAKLNPSGGYIWAKRYGGNPTDSVANPAIAVRPFAPGAVSGDIALTGTFTGKITFNATDGIEAVGINNNANVFIAKLLSVQ